MESRESTSWRDMKGDAVSDSADLRRILELPKRELHSPEFLQDVAGYLKEELGRKDITRETCRCRDYYPHRKDPHCDNLLPTQAWALYEGALVGGLLGPIGVGHGKTLLNCLMSMVVDGAKTVLLLLSAPLKRQFLDVDWHYYSQHWQLPNLSGANPYVSGRPFLHVLSFPEISSAKNTDLLEKLNPDIIIVDEAHNLRNTTAARTKRFNRYLAEAQKVIAIYQGRMRPKVKLFCWSGTLTDKGMEDYAKLSEFSLGDGSPVPLNWSTVQEWASALDPSDNPNPPGHLRKLGGATPLEGLRMRIAATLGVVSSGDKASCNAQLLINERVVTIPHLVQGALSKFDAAAKEEAWQRPDGEELVDALQAARCARELSCGFYYRWHWPKINGQAQQVKVIERWLEARKSWHRELRSKLKVGREHMDSPLLVTKAAIRWQKGFIHVHRNEETGEVLGRKEYPPHTKHGPLPTWDSEFWPQWEELRDTAHPENEAVWLDDFLVDDALAWLKEGPGLCWYEFNAFASRLAERGRSAGLVFAGPGNSGSNIILSLKGSERVIASIRAHGTGRNLQMFARNLVANPPAGGGTWEQLLGRTHRQGQEEDEVICDVYRHTEAFRNAVTTAHELSEHIEGTFGAKQRLASVAKWNVVKYK